MATSLQIQQIASALKRANQRIVQLRKTYGAHSSVYKQEVGKFLKASYSPYIRVTNLNTRQSTKTFSVTKDSWKPNEQRVAFDIRAVKKLVKTHGIDSTEVTRMLADMAGIKFDAEGNMKEIKGAGVPTVSDLDRRARKKLERLGEDPFEKSPKELRKITEELAQFSESFQTAYNDYKSKHTEDEMRKDPIISKLYSENREHRLTYASLEKIRDAMMGLREEATDGALKFEEDEGIE